MSIESRFLDYVRYGTTSKENSATFPSTASQLVLAKHLKDELLKLGIEDAYLDEYGYVYGTLKGSDKYLTIGLNSHMDTSDAVNGDPVNPKIIEKYDGGCIELNPDVVMDPTHFSNLNNYVGQRLITTDGTSLLGGDDKAGIAIIMELLAHFIAHPELEHGDIKVCFSPDEEIGRGTEHFNYDYFKVDFAYTLDGGRANIIAYECFNAASAKVSIRGMSTHPGSAKDKMINALNLAHEFHGLLDPLMRPEHTEGYEGFNHLLEMQGTCEACEMAYIIRNHDLAKLNDQKQAFLKAAEKINRQYPEAVQVTLIDSYRNMKEQFIGREEPIELVKAAMKKLGMDYREEAIRGGTDGAELTFNGIPCPNLGTGAENCHGIYEFVSVDEMLKVFELVKEVLLSAEK